uniref:Peptidase A2 domain-containing protein n=1 Tax=Romanomermis culicivorax TaxID=13658 RepID=A0A915K909_ROMCU
ITDFTIKKPTEPWIPGSSVCRIEECSQKDIKLLSLYPPMLAFHMDADIGKTKTQALIHTGAQCSVISSCLVQCSLGIDYDSLETLAQIKFADGAIVVALG